MAGDAQTMREVLIGLAAAGGMALIQNLPKIGGFLGLQWTEKQKLEGLQRDKLITLLETGNQEKSVIIQKLEGRLENAEGELGKVRIQLAELQIFAGTNRQRMDEVKRDIGPMKHAADVLNHMTENLEK